MRVDTIVFATNDYDLEVIKNEEKFFETYLFENTEGRLNAESATFDSLENVYLSLKYLFGNLQDITELYKNEELILLNLAGAIGKATTVEELENWYQDWIIESKRENSMDEYGQFIGLISYIQEHSKEKYLLMIINLSKS